MHEQKLVSQLKSGNERALEKIIDLYSNYVATIIYNIGGSRLTSEDRTELISDVFYRLWTYKENLNSEQLCLKPYIGKIAKNLSINRLRKLKLQEIQFEDDIIIYQNTIDDLEKNELKNLLLEALQQLSDKEKIIFIKFYYQNETTKEISKQLAISESTVRSKLKRGRDKLKKILVEGGYQYEG